MLVSLDDRWRKIEAHLIEWALKMSAGNKSKAAEPLVIKRSTLGDRMNRCGLGGQEANDRTFYAVADEVAKTGKEGRESRPA